MASVLRQTRLLIFLCAMVAPHLGYGQSKEAARVSKSALSSLYLFNPDGEFQQVVGSGPIAGWHWTIARMADVAPGLVERCQDLGENHTDCPWKLFAIHYQPIVHFFYGITSPDGIHSGHRSYEFLGLFPEMLKLAAFIIAGDAPFAPVVSVSPDGERLFVLREEQVSPGETTAGGEYRLVLETYRMDRLWNGFAKQQTVTSIWHYSTSRAQHLSESGYLNESGTIVYDGLNRINIDNGAMTLKTEDPLKVLSEEQKKELRDFTSQPVEQVATEIRILDSAEGTVLVGIANGHHDQLAIFTIDLATQARTPIVVIPGGRVSLLPGNRMVLLQFSAQAKGADGAFNLFEVRDLTTGNRVFELHGELDGLGVGGDALVCLPSGLLVYPVGAKVAVMAIKEGAHPALIQTTFRPGAGTQCAGLADTVDATGIAAGAGMQ